LSKADNLGIIAEVKYGILFFLLIVVFISGFYIWSTKETQFKKIGTMEISSLAFKVGEKIPDAYTCDGRNISPPLSIRDIPAETRSLAIIVDDPDAPSGDWVHWTAWNISPETKEIIEGATPKGASEGATDFGKPGYGGPCPHSGMHRYFFKLYALDAELNLASNAAKKDIEGAMEGHIVAQTSLMGRYQRGQ